VTTQPRQDPDDVHGRRRQHHGPFLVDVAGDQIQDLREPGCQCAVLLRAEADAAVAGRPCRVREIEGQLADRFGADSRSASDARRRELVDQGGE
jgi:hypothetical protein